MPHLPVSSSLLWLSVFATSRIAQGQTVTVGPVPLENLPGVVCDNDGAANAMANSFTPGTAQGRSRTGANAFSGLTFTCTITDDSLYETLEWQLLSAAMALDGLFDDAATTYPGETLFPAVAGPNGSTCAPSAASIQCTGTTRIQNVGSTYTQVSTRFTATVTGGTISVNEVDLSSLVMGDVFTINMLFEASTTTWTPALDFFDAYNTPPSANGDALTSFSQGFVAEISATSTCDTVLAELINQFGVVNGKLDANKNILDYLFTEVSTGQIPAILSGVGNINSEVTSTFPQLTSNQLQILAELANIQNQLGSSSTMELQLNIACILFGNIQVPSGPSPAPLLDLCAPFNQVPGLDIYSLASITDQLDEVGRGLICSLAGSIIIDGQDACGDATNFFAPDTVPNLAENRVLLRGLTTDSAAHTGLLNQIINTQGTHTMNLGTIIGNIGALATQVGNNFAAQNSDLLNIIGSQATHTGLLNQITSTQGNHTTDLNSIIGNIGALATQVGNSFTAQDLNLLDIIDSQATHTGLLDQITSTQATHTTDLGTMIGDIGELATQVNSSFTAQDSDLLDIIGSQATQTGTLNDIINDLAYITQCVDGIKAQLQGAVDLRIQVDVLSSHCPRKLVVLVVQNGVPVDYDLLAVTALNEALSSEVDVEVFISRIGTGKYIVRVDDYDDCIESSSKSQSEKARRRAGVSSYSKGSKSSRAQLSLYFVRVVVGGEEDTIQVLF